HDFSSAGSCLPLSATRAIGSGEPRRVSYARLAWHARRFWRNSPPRDGNGQTFLPKESVCTSGTGECTNPFFIRRNKDGKQEQTRTRNPLRQDQGHHLGQ